MPIRKEIVYPIFLECCQYTEDFFWKNIFEDLSYGKSPFGTYITKDFLCCSYKKKEFSYKIEEKPSRQIYDEVCNLFTNKLGLLSHVEKIKKRDEFDNFEKNIQSTRKEWADIKKKNMRDILIELYVIKMKNKYLLSVAQAGQLLSVILIAIIFKVITSKDIEFENGCITHINGIDFEQHKFVMERNFQKVEVSFSSCIIIDKKLMSDNWEKYIKDLKKISEKDLL